MTLKKNSGRSKTLAPRPEREYLLKGIIRCAYCLMPMWAQTYASKQQYHREHRASRSLEDCPPGWLFAADDPVTLSQHIGAIRRTGW